MALQLYSFWRSSAAYRVRIALHYKGLPFATIAKHLVRDGGEQRKADYLAVNPQGLVPALADDGQVIPQSLAICEYLEETHPEPRLLPGGALDRATIRSLALAVIAALMSPSRSAHRSRYVQPRTSSATGSPAACRAEAMPIALLLAAIVALQSSAPNARCASPSATAS